VKKTVKEKIVEHQGFRRVSILSSVMVSTAILVALLTFPRAQAQDKMTATAAIPSGTILPIRLNSSLSSSKTQPGQIITARITQDGLWRMAGKSGQEAK
jgi:hypothetical protein